jgi:hypothetical protein
LGINILALYNAELVRHKAAVAQLSSDHENRVKHIQELANALGIDIPEPSPVSLALVLHGHPTNAYLQLSSQPRKRLCVRHISSDWRASSNTEVPQSDDPLPVRHAQPTMVHSDVVKSATLAHLGVDGLVEDIDSVMSMGFEVVRIDTTTPYTPVANKRQPSQEL